jgi:hypothetical protein
MSAFAYPIMAFELSHTLSCVHIPHSKSIVIRSRDDCPTIKQGDHAIDHLRDEVKIRAAKEKRSSSTPIPQESYLSFTYIIMAFELSHTLSCVHIPHSKSIVI